MSVKVYVNLGKFCVEVGLIWFIIEGLYQYIYVPTWLHSGQFLRPQRQSIFAICDSRKRFLEILDTETDMHRAHPIKKY